MPGNDKTPDGQKRGVPWFLLLIVLLIGLLLWWLSRVRVPVRVAEKTRVEESVKSPNADGELSAQLVQSDVDRRSLPVTNQFSAPSPAIIEISGRVTLRGARLKERVLAIQRNRDGSETKRMSRDYEVSDGGGLENVFVWVQKGLEGKVFAKPNDHLRLTATNWFMDPYMVGARVDQAVQLVSPNHSHDFQMISSRGDRFSWERDSDGHLLKTPLDLIFNGPDVLSRLVCKVHDWEWAYFGVVEHPFFAVTDKDGYFKLPRGISPGKYTIAVHHPKAGRQTRSIEAAPGGKYDLLFRLRAPEADANLIAATPVTETEGESLEERGESRPTRSEKRTNQDGISDGAPITGNDPLSAGVIRGRVSLRGTPPPEKPLDVLKNDPLCGKLITNVPNTRFYVTGEDGGLADTVVYLASESFQRMKFPPRTPLLLDQVNCEYAPYVAAVQTGQKLLVRNSDPLLHNVHPTPIATGNRESNKAQMPKAADLEFTFEATEEFLRFKCDIHPWMFSYVSVFDHPFFAVTDVNGNFSITNVPPGAYRILATHRRAGKVSTVVSLSRGQGSEVNLTLDPK